MVRDRLTDAEWAIFAPFLTEQSARGGRPPKDHRRTLDGIFWITRYDHTASSFLGFALLGCIRLWIRFVHAA